MVRESQGKGFFHLGQGKSGKLALVREKQHFQAAGQGENFIFHCQRSIKTF